MIDGDAGLLGEFPAYRLLQIFAGFDEAGDQSVKARFEFPVVRQQKLVAAGYRDDDRRRQLRIKAAAALRANQRDIFGATDGRSAATAAEAVLFTPVEQMLGPAGGELGVIGKLRQHLPDFTNLQLRRQRRPCR